MMLGFYFSGFAQILLSSLLHLKIEFVMAQYPTLSFQYLIFLFLTMNFVCLIISMGVRLNLIHLNGNFKLFTNLVH